MEYNPMMFLPGACVVMTTWRAPGGVPGFRRQQVLDQEQGEDYMDIITKQATLLAGEFVIHLPAQVLRI